MRQATLKLKMYMGNANIIDSNAKGSLLRGILCYLGVLALLYVVFLGSMVFNIIERKSVEAKVRTLSSEVGGLELSYLSLSGKIDLNYSYELGFKEAEVKFATRKSIRPIGANTGSVNNSLKNEI